MGATSRPPVADRYAEAVRLPDGSIENFTIRINGRLFKCNCGCNVFHKPDRKHLNIYECNACKTRFEGEPSNVE